MVEEETVLFFQKFIVNRGGRKGKTRLRYNICHVRNKHRVIQECNKKVHNVDLQVGFQKEVMFKVSSEGSTMNYKY